MRSGALLEGYIMAVTISCITHGYRVCNGLLCVSLVDLNLCRNTGQGDDDPDGPSEMLVNSNRDLCLVFTHLLR